MIWAIQNGIRETATPNSFGACPCCNTEVIAKCGSIVSWHWAHRNNDCDPWSEPESEWHLAWKRKFPKTWQEVVIGNHRADVKTPKLVIEFQASPISPEDIREREEHYGNMIWVIKGHEFEDNFCVRDSTRKICLCCSNEFSLRIECCPFCRSFEYDVIARDYFTFRWKHPRKSWFVANSPIFIHFDCGIFNIKKLYHNAFCAGWGQWIMHSEFLEKFGAPTGQLELV